MAHRMIARRSLQLTALAAALLIAASAALAERAAAQDLTLESIGPTFTSPIYVTAPRGETRRLFVVERAGRIQVVRDGEKLPEPFLDISSDVSTAGERGLLSMAFAPDYGTSGRLYVFYTDSDGDLRVDELTRSAADPERADPGSRRSLLVIEHSARQNHNGGQLQFGPDGLLYVATGDGGGGNDPDGNGQDKESLLGKLLRIDPQRTATAPYTVPASNPFVDRAGRDEIYAYGLRNPFRFSFDRATGDLTIGDVGQGRAEEIDYRLRDDPAGANFGWVCFEGFQQNTNVSPPCSPPNHVPPVFEYERPEGTCASITGGYVVRDRSLGDLAGRYVYGDYCTGEIRSLKLAKPSATGDADTGLRAGTFTLASFGEDACGRVYAVSLRGGTVWRLQAGEPAPCPRPATPPPPDTTPPRLTLSGPYEQRFRKQGRIVRVNARCDEPCTVESRWIYLGGDIDRRYELKPLSRRLSADTKARLELRLYTNARRAIIRELERTRSLPARVKLVAHDDARNKDAATRRVKLTR